MTVVFHQGALGDFVVALPLLRALQAMQAVHGPVTVVTSSSKAHLAATMVDGVRPVSIDQPAFTVLHGPAAELPGGAAGAVLRKATRIVSFVSSGGDNWGANVRRLCPEAACLFVQPRPPADWPDHVSAWHRHQLRRQGLEVPEIQVAPGSNPRGPVVIHPGSGGLAKCWPLDRFESLGWRLLDRGEQVTMVLGEAELECWAGEAVDCLARAFDLARPATPPALYDLLSTAGAFIGNDSGPTHLAAQMGLPTLALFGPTSPVHWAPLGPRVTILAPPEPAPMDWLSVDQTVRECLRAIRPLQPTGGPLR